MRKLFGTTGWTAVLLAAALCISVTLTASAAPLWAEVVTIREPDGSSVEIRVWGDEFYSVGETLDGYTIVRDRATGLLSYAELSADGTELVSTGVAAGEPAPQRGLEKHIRITPEAARAQALAVREDFERRASGAPLDQLSRGMRGLTIGDVVGITLIVDFSDDVATIPPADIDNYCNDIGYTGYGNNGSVREYFLDVSEGLLNYTNFVPTHYFRAPNTKAYYCDPIAPYGQRARQLVQEALQDLDDNGFDFSQYDSDGDGIIDAVNCFYAGDTWNAWAEGLWPHAYTVTWCADGVCTHAYQITNLGSQLRIGTFCHENGHMLMGWPDLYDYGYDSQGTGDFCLMSGGSWNGSIGSSPSHMSAWCKVDLGWVTPTTISSGGVYPISQVETTSQIYKMQGGFSSNEYFLVENRQGAGFDSALPGSLRGLMIWHVDENQPNNDYQTHFLVDVEEASCTQLLELNTNSGEDSDYFRQGNVTEFTGVTTPNNHSYSGSPLGLDITSISATGAMMSFSVNGMDLSITSPLGGDIVDVGEVPLHRPPIVDIYRLSPQDGIRKEEIGHVGPSPGAVYREEPQAGAGDFVEGRVGVRHEFISFFRGGVEAYRMIDIVVH